MKLVPYLFVMLFIISCAHNDAPQGHYQSLPVTADGYANEWQMPLRFTNKDYTMSYNITNDKKNIYIVVVSKDDEMERRILRSGITLYFDAKGENNKNVSLTFPERKISNTNSAPRNGKPIVNDTSNTNNTKHAMVLQSDTYDVKGFYELENGQFSVKDKRSKIQLGIKTNVDSGLVYEAIIPINYVLENGLTSKALRKNFSIGIVVHNDIGNSAGRNQNNYVAHNNAGLVQPRVSVGGGFGGFGMGGARMGIGMGGGGSHRQGNYNNQENRSGQTEELLWYQFRFTDKAN